MEICLRPWSTDDRAILADLISRVDRRYLSNRLPDPYTLQDADWWLNMVKEQDGQEGLFRSITVDGIPAGNLTIERCSDVHEKDGEIGYFLDERFQNQGVMTEAVRQICPLAFRELGLLRITGLVYEPNLASRRVLENNGFVLEGIKKQAVYKNKQVYHLYIYGKYRE